MLGNDHFKPFPNIAKLLYQKHLFVSNAVTSYSTYAIRKKAPPDLNV